MRTDIPAALLEHFRQDSTSRAILWTIERRDGEMIRGTEHDQDIQLDSAGDFAGLYLRSSSFTLSDLSSSSELSVDNTEAEGTVQQDPVTVLNDLSISDIEGGQFDMAPVTVLVCNWRDTSMGYAIIRTGFLGEITRDSDGRYKTEVRGLKQLLSQSILQSYSERCNVVRFGDVRCGFDVDSVTIVVGVTSVESRRRFHVSGITTQPETFFAGGILRGVTGLNAGVEREVKRDNRNGDHGFIDLWDQMPLDVQTGDSFELEPGCDRAIGTCRDKWDNVVNFRGYGVLIPGLLELLKGPV